MRFILIILTMVSCDITTSKARSVEGEMVCVHNKSYVIKSNIGDTLFLEENKHIVCVSASFSYKKDAR